MTLDTFVRMYLDWVNNFLTVERFADYYGISIDRANEIISIGRHISDIELKPESGTKYQVVVGNIGQVVDTNDRVEALAAYNEYVKQSTEGYGRAAGESVTLFRDGEPWQELVGAED